MPEGKNEARKKYKFGEIPFCGQVQKSNFSTFVLGHKMKFIQTYIFSGLIFALWHSKNSIPDQEKCFYGDE